MGQVDRKYDGRLIKVASGEEVDDFIVFRARDNAVPHVLAMYKVLCKSMGCDVEHLQAIDNLLDNVENWRSHNPGLCQVPTTRLSELQAKLKEY